MPTKEFEGALKGIHIQGKSKYTKKLGQNGNRKGKSNSKVGTKIAFL